MPRTATAPAHTEAAAIVDDLIAERSGGLAGRPRAWRAARAVIDPLFGYDAAVALTADIAPLTGVGVMEHVRRLLALEVETSGLAAIPANGPVVIVANHPGGIADGVAVWSALRQHRPDVCYFANRDAWRVAAGLRDVVIPVEWRDDERTREKTRETVKHASAAFRAGRAVVIFPAGRIAQWRWRRSLADSDPDRASIDAKDRRWSPGLEEPPWQASALALARKYNAAIVPLGVHARMSRLYYVLQHVSEPLKHMTLFHELMNKRGAPYRLRFGPAASPTDWDDDAAAITALRQQSLALAGGL